MLKEACLSDLKKKVAPGHCIIVHSEGEKGLGPSKDIFQAFFLLKKKYEREYMKGSAEAHNQAYKDSNYEEKFRKQILSDDLAMMTLDELSDMSKEEDIYLVCYEGNTKACHRRILLRICEEEFGAIVQVDGVEP